MRKNLFNVITFNDCVFNMRNLLLLVGFSALISCVPSPREVDLDSVNRSALFSRFDEAFFNSDTADFTANLDQLASQFPEFFVGGKNPIFWKAQRTDELQLELYQQSKAVFPSFESLNENLNFSVKHYYYYFPNSPSIKFYSYISNLDFDYPVLFSDSVCFAALDMYLGPKQPYYKDLPEYISFYRQPAFMIRDIMYEIVSSQMEPLNAGGSFLDAMIHHGKLLYTVQMTMPQSEENLIIQFTPEQINFCTANERSMWAYFIENNYLFSTSQDLKNRFIELAPFSKFRMQFDKETPGMTGRWLGLQIVKSYAEKNPKLSLNEILAEKDSRKILKLSGYKP